MIRIAGPALTAEIAPLGAELVSLRDADGRELMTDADPAFWTGHAPLLFPIVGALAGGEYRLDGRSYALPQHGFARRRTFDLVKAEDGSAEFRLRDDAETRAVYPFAFELRAVHAIEGEALTTTVTVASRDTRDMPASFGFHPAFAWPLPFGGDKAAHELRFETEEPEPLARLEGGLVAGRDRASPLDGARLALSDDLFAADALIWDRLESRALTYGVPGQPRLRFDFPDAPMLGIWTKPGAKFVCVEPWWGIADPAGFTGEVWEKPGIMRLAPGERRSFAMRVSLIPG